MKTLIVSIVCLSVGVLGVKAKDYKLSDYGVKPNSEVNVSPIIFKIVEQIKNDKCASKIIFEQGKYNFYPESSSVREYYISNHDQNNPKMVGIALEGLKNVTVEGNGADLVFHGRMLPISIVNGSNCVVKELSIDFAQPHIAQVKVVANDTANHLITYEIAPWVTYEIRNNRFINKGDGWENEIVSCIAFEEKTKRLVYRSSDVDFRDFPNEIIGERLVRAKWNNPMLIPGTVLALRSWYRPSPGIFIDRSKNTTIQNVTVHYAEGMGLLAQMSENITLNKFNVALKGDTDPRYFTTQADATHFSGCKGQIISTGGLYEGMMDDAINIHGTYLKIIEKVNASTVRATYMHHQAWGFFWGENGDKVQFVKPNTMEILGGENSIKNIKPIDKPVNKGVKLFEIEFNQPLDDAVIEACGIENLTWTPSVLFADNVVRNNRARGALFSTPKRTVIENNLFDHTSGTAILLCGDCNGWFETGACRDVVIRNNKFINALTSMFQFTNAVISIYPEIPNLADQKKYFHGGKKDAILIENNIFEMFDKPIVYAKSVNGLTFRNNTIVNNNDYPSFHFIKTPFFFERVINWNVEGNTFDQPFDSSKDIIVR